MTKDIRVRLTEQDKLFLQAKADAERLQLSSYVRNQLLGGIETNSKI